MAGIKEGFSKGIATINVKTANLLEENKLKTYISTLESEIEKIKLNIGEIVYKGWCDNTFTLEQIRPELNALTEKINLVEKTKNDIEELKEKERKILGASQIDNKPNVETLFCSRCGSIVSVGSKFCEKCGNKIEQ